MILVAMLASTFINILDQPNPGSRQAQTWLSQRSLATSNPIQGIQGRGSWRYPCATRCSFRDVLCVACCRTSYAYNAPGFCPLRTGVIARAALRTFQVRRLPAEATGTALYPRPQLRGSHLLHLLRAGHCLQPWHKL